jgi:MFS family permease
VLRGIDYETAVIGWWTDLHASRRWPFLAGLIVLLASTFIMWLANPISLQIFSRVLQGIADAIIYITGMAIIIDTVSTKRVAEYMGYVTIMLNIGTFAGPLLGGAIYETGGYHAVWGMMVGFVVLDTILRVVMVEKKAVTSDAKTLSMNRTVDDTTTTSTLSTVTIALTAAVPESYRTTHESLRTKPRIPDVILLLNSPRMITACIAICVQSMVFSGFETVLSIYVQEIWDYNALGAGLLFIPLTVPAFFAPLLGRLVDRTSSRWALVLGFLGMCPVIILVRYVTHNSMGQKVLMCFFLFMIGLGITIILGPSMAEVSYIAEEFVSSRPESTIDMIDKERSAYAQAYALNAMAWSLGNIAGPLLCGLIRDEYGWGTMCWVLGLICGLTAVPCFFWAGRPCSTRIWHRKIHEQAQKFGN